MTNDQLKLSFSLPFELSGRKSLLRISDFYYHFIYTVYIIIYELLEFVWIKCTGKTDLFSAQAEHTLNTL